MWLGHSPLIAVNSSPSIFGRSHTKCSHLVQLSLLLSLLKCLIYNLLLFRRFFSCKLVGPFIIWNAFKTRNSYKNHKLSQPGDDLCDARVRNSDFDEFFLIVEIRRILLSLPQASTVYTIIIIMTHSLFLFINFQKRLPTQANR